MKARRLILVALGLLLPLLAQAQNTLVITEFMAANASTLADEDGDFSDWIEIHNPTSSAISYAGYALTDDQDNLQQWRFPAASLGAGDYEIIFASGKDRATFALSWETVIDWGDEWQYWVGTSAPPEDWIEPSFDDASWDTGASGFGYGDDDDATVVETVMAVFVRKTFTVDQASGIVRALLDIDYDDAFVAYLNGVEIARARIGSPGVRPGFDQPANSPIEPLIATGQLPERYEIDDLANLLVDGGNVLAIEVHNVSLQSSDMTLIPFLTFGYADPQDPPGQVSDDIASLPGQEFHTNFRLSQNGEYLALVAPDGSTATAFDPEYPSQSDDISYGFRDGELGYLTSPSPGRANNTLIVGFTEAPHASVEHGFYDAPFQVTLRSATPDAAIRYTLNGDAPTPATGFIYRDPVLIEGTSVLRAAAFKPGFENSPVMTHTYLFVADIVTQSISGSPPNGWPFSWGGNDVDYGMDFQIVGQEGSESRMAVQEALKALPALALSTNLDNLFDNDIGIYANAQERGRDWERLASAELIYADGTAGFHINAGLRIRGGFSRNDNNPKHAFRLFFRDELLNYPLFGDEGVDEFENIDIRTSQNYSWSFNGDGRNTMNRDVFSRDIQRDMGVPYTKSRYYHLFLNGQYWGIFQSQERSEASYGASYLGGNKANYDVLKSTERAGGFYELEATDGNTDAWLALWNLANTTADVGSDAEADALYFQARGLNPDASINPDYPVLLDVDNLINYMLVVFYSGNFDGPISWFLGNEHINNFYAMRDRTGDHGFHFFAHDNEHTLLLGAEQGFDRTGPYPAGNIFEKSNPQWLHQQFMRSPEYRLRFADVAFKHLVLPGGALRGEQSTARFQARADELENAIIAESARWGDSKRDDPLGVFHWRNAINDITENFFPGRNDDIKSQLQRTRSFTRWEAPTLGSLPNPIYPIIDAPGFTQQGGMVASGFELKLATVADTAYYTLDGSDPRLIGGALSPSAILYDRTHIPITQRTHIKTRAIEEGQWSPINEARFYVDAAAPETASLAITEIHYNPYDPSAEEIAAGYDNSDDFEYIEFQNISSTPLDLTGASFTDGIDFTFGEYSLAPGAYVLIVRDPDAFALRHGDGLPVAGDYAGRLSNAGERLELKAQSGATIHSFEYDMGGAWPNRADGNGSSLAFTAQDDSYGEGGSWRSSLAFNGTPGAAPLEDAPQVIFNEVLTHTDVPLFDAIELHNPTTADIDVSGWYLSDTNVYQMFSIPPGTVIPAGGYVSFDESHFNHPDDPNGFALNSARGDVLWLLEADANGNLVRFVDHIEFGAAANGESFGRWPDGVGDFYPMTSSSLGSENAGPRTGPVVIQEIMYHPPNNDQFLEYVEILNAGNETESLDEWTFSNGISFNFPAGMTLAPNQRLRIVPFDPIEELDKLGAFDAIYEHSQSAPMVGPWEGRLNNTGERLTLSRADDPPAEEPGFFPQITEDMVRYRTEDPWPTDASDSGFALVRIDPFGFSGDPANWTTERRTVEPEPPLEPVEGYELSHFFPNPTAERAELIMRVEEAQQVRIMMYDALGREIRLLHDGRIEEHQVHRIQLRTAGLAGGVYFVQIQAEQFRETRSVVVVR